MTEDTQQPEIPHVRRFFHTGDLGDIVAMLPVMRHMGGGDLFLGRSSRQLGQHQYPREPMTDARYAFLAPLLAAQEYVLKVSHEDDPAGIDMDFTTVRKHKNGRAQSLVDWHGRFAGINDLDKSPWLKVKPSDELRGKQVICRSLRYHAPGFVWHSFIKRFSDPVFMGLDGEHEEFCRVIRRTIPHRKVKDALEMAELMAGSKQIIANQSAPGWIAMGLGTVPFIQESFHHIPNSRVPNPKFQFLFHAR